MGATLWNDIAVPGSKSDAIRSLVVSALALGDSVVAGAPASGDVRATVGALRRLGVTILGEPGEGVLRVRGTGGTFAGGRRTLSVGGSATALRFLACVAALRAGTTVIDGDSHLRRRPAGPLAEVLEPLGLLVRARAGRPPLTLSGGPVLAGERGVIAVPADSTSQVLSGLMLLAAALPGGLRLAPRGEGVSAPYVDLTAGVLRRAGARVTRRSECIKVRGPLLAVRHEVEADWSSAAYPLLSAALLRRPVRVPGLRARSVQADRAVVALLAAAGVRCTVGADGARCSGPRSGSLRPFRFDLRHCPDLAPVAAVLALFAPGESRIHGAAHLRWKEVDRIAACVDAVRALGGRARALRDGFSIVGGAPRPGTVDSRGDHRIALAFSVAAAAIPGARVRAVGCIAKSWPGALGDMAGLFPVGFAASADLSDSAQSFKGDFLGGRGRGRPRSAHSVRRSRGADRNGPFHDGFPDPHP